MLLLVTWLWILTGTISVGFIVVGIISNNPSMFGYHESIIFGVLGYVFGGGIGETISRFLPFVIRLQRQIGWTLSLILPVLVISLTIFQNPELIDDGYPLFFMAPGIFGSAYVVWIPRWVKHLRQKSHGDWWIVVVTLALVMLNTFFILAPIYVLMSLGQ